MCDTCGRIYQTSSDRRPRFAPMTCACGVRLMQREPVGDALGLHSSLIPVAIPIDDEAVELPLSDYEDTDFTARPICYLCFRAVDKRHAGRIPNWVSKGPRTN
jgi:hypothetical protein